MLQRTEQIEMSRAATSRPAVFVPGTPAGSVSITRACKSRQEPGISFPIMPDRSKLCANHSLSLTPSCLDSKLRQCLIRCRHENSELFDLAQVRQFDRIMTDARFLASVFVFLPESFRSHLSTNRRLWKAENNNRQPLGTDTLSASTARSHTTPCVPGAGFCAVEGAGGFDV